jgi:CMP-N,N'-diacetyllegionaminic acid synthase
MVKRLAIIPARSGSKRVKNKNIRIFKGKRLIINTLEQVKKSKFFSKIHVSTDCKKIKKIVEDFDINIDFLRPKKLSKDNVAIKNVIEFILKKYLNLGIEFDEIWLFYISNPFLSTKHIKQGYKIYLKDKKENSVMSVSKYNYPIEWALTPDKDNFLKLNSKKKIKKDIFCEAGMFLIYQKNYLLNKNKLKYKPYIIPLWDTVDIDTEEDFILASKLK